MPAPVRRDATVRIEAKVLVAEDQPVNQLVTTGLLELLGCTVEVAADGALAVERWRNTAFDLTLMDCNMPEMDGYAATRAPRAEETKLGRTRVPIIALTANGMADERAACLAAGMDDYLSKPCGKEALMDVIKRYAPRCVRERAA